MKNNYLLVDVMNMIFRYYYSPVSDRAGKTAQERLTNIDLYVSSILQSVIKKHRIELYESPKDYIPLENIILALDSKSWRHELVDDYKGTRTYDPDDIKVILAVAERLEVVAKGMNLNIIKAPRLEADDLIALFVIEHSKSEPESHFKIVTTDDDYTQLKNYANVTIYNPIRKGLNEKDGKMALTVKTIMGDDSDNIKNTMIKLDLDGKEVKLRMGKKTIPQSINGRFHCNPPNNVSKEIKYHNKKLEIATVCSGKRHVLFSSEKCSIEFDDNYRLVPEQKLKFDKSVDKERQEELTRRMGLLIEEIIEYGEGDFERHEDFKEDFIIGCITSLVEKFKKDHKEHVKKNNPELTKPKEISDKSSEEWFSDLIKFNKAVFSNEEHPQTEIELISDLCKKLDQNIRHNETMIDFKNIPEELIEEFKKSTLPQILSKKPQIDREGYLNSIGLVKLSATLRREENSYKQELKKANGTHP